MKARAGFDASNLWSVVGRALAAWRRRVHDRDALAQLSARERLDLGLPRLAAGEEIRKRLWLA